MTVFSPVSAPVAEQDMDAVFRKLRRLHWWSLGIVVCTVLIIGVTTVTRTEEGGGGAGQGEALHRRDVLTKPLA